MKSLEHKKGADAPHIFILFPISAAKVRNLSVNTCKSIAQYPELSLRTRGSDYTIEENIELFIVFGVCTNSPY